MENEAQIWSGILIGVLGAISGGFGTWLMNFYIKKRELDAQQNKEQNTIHIAENAQAVEIYRELVKTLKEDLLKLSEELEQLENGYLIAREENARLKAIIEHLEKKDK